MFDSLKKIFGVDIAEVQDMEVDEGVITPTPKEGHLPTQDLTRDEYLATQGIWKGDGHVHQGCEVVHDPAEVDGVQYEGLAIFHTVHGMSFFAGFLVGVHAAANVEVA